MDKQPQDRLSTIKWYQRSPIFSLFPLLLIGFFFMPLKSCHDQPLNAGMRSEKTSVSAPGRDPIDSPTIDGKHHGKPGEKTDIKLSNGDVAGVKLTWNPPPGASGFNFPENQQPEPGGPPFVWNNVDAGASIDASYNLPEIPPDRPADQTYTCSNGLTADDGEGNSSSSIYTTEINPNFTNLAEGEQAVPTKRHPSGQQPQEDTMLWYVDEIINSEEITMTTETCQDVFDVWQQENMFKAIRAPIPAPDSAISYTIPVVYQKGNYPNLTLHSDPWAYAPVISGTAEIRFDYLTYLDNEMPPPEGEDWVAMGLSSTEPITCPQGMEYPPNGWSLITEMWMDLDDPAAQLEDMGEPIVLTSYVCFEGSTLEAQRSGFFAMGFEGEVIRTPANGYFEQITCIGPQYQFLDGTSELVLRTSETRFITSTQTISFTHTLFNQGGTPISVTLETSSTLEMQWKFYAQPDGTGEIINPIHMDGGANRQLQFWIFGTIPPGTSDGSYSVTVTATSDAEPPASVWTADTIWVGTLEIPPEPIPGPEPEKDLYLYLPVLYR